MNSIENSCDLKELYPSPKESALKKVLFHLDAHCIRFIELSPFCILSTSDLQRYPDVSPRGGEVGFIKIMDPNTLLIPDRPGNNRLDSLTNLTSNPYVALLFLVPGIDETLRLYGAAEILADRELNAQFKAHAVEPKTIIKVKIAQAYFQCAKSLMRARLWDETMKVDRKSFPTLGEILKDQLRTDGPIETHEEMQRRYQRDL